MGGERWNKFSYGHGSDCICGTYRKLGRCIFSEDSAAGRWWNFILRNSRNIAGDWRKMAFLREKGGTGVFVSKLLPMVRTLISIPAGMVKMNFTKYTVSSACGIFLWNLGVCRRGIFLRRCGDQFLYINLCIIFHIIFYIIWKMRVYLIIVIRKSY